MDIKRGVVFEVGKVYEWYQRDYGTVKIVKRTPKCVWVTNGINTWRMKLRTDEYGNEYVVDSTVPSRWRDAFTCSALWRTN